MNDIQALEATSIILVGSFGDMVQNIKYLSHHLFGEELHLYLLHFLSNHFPRYFELTFAALVQ